MFSILILTQDEELNLADCLDSIAWCDDVWILDSGSTDRTLAIAEQRGCHILHRKFDNFGDQRNYAIDTAKFKYPWVFDLDADERFTPELRAECEELVRRDEKSAYFVANKMMLLGKWIRHASQFPVYQMRFHKLGEIRFVPHGHGQREGAAARGIGYCQEAYIHYNFSKGLGDWFQKHAKYALREAEQQLADESADRGTKTGKESRSTADGEKKIGVENRSGEKKVGQESRSTAEGLNSPLHAGEARERGSDFQVASEKDQSSIVHLHLSPSPSRQPNNLTTHQPNTSPVPLFSTPIFSPTPLSRRRKLKRLVSNLPGRSWIKFFYLLILRGGILDGPAGWLYCRMQAHYEFMCTTILKDLRQKGRTR